jgi:salicylate hydroxylase
VSDAQRRLIVTGAGIGGLTAALALAHAGFEVIVLEKATELQEVGAGIQLSPNAARLLIALGLGPALAPRVFAPDGIRIFSVLSGGEITTVPLGGTAATRYDGPFWTVHRADLHAVLADEARRTPGIRIELAAELRKAESHPGGITAHVAVAGAERSITAAGLIGADGVHSAIRTRLLDGPVARYAGKMAFRAVIPIGEAPMDLRRVGGLWLAPKAHVVHYPVRAGRDLNIVAIVDGDWQDEGWSAPVTRQEVLSHFSSRPGGDWPDLARSILTVPTSWTKWALRGVDPRFEWTGGVVTLIGDAAHAMLPFAAQGACMAIEDAIVLAEHLAENDNTAEAMRLYEASRKARVSAVWQLSANNGRGYHLGPALGRLRDITLRVAGGTRILARQGWIYDWSPS